jgi:hypothetical protein
MITIIRRKCSCWSNGGFVYACDDGCCDGFQGKTVEELLGQRQIAVSENHRLLMGLKIPANERRYIIYPGSTLFDLGCGSSALAVVRFVRHHGAMMPSVIDSVRARVVISDNHLIALGFYNGNIVVMHRPFCGHLVSIIPVGACPNQVDVIRITPSTTLPLEEGWGYLFACG